MDHQGDVVAKGIFSLGGEFIILLSNIIIILGLPRLHGNNNHVHGFAFI